MTARPPRSLAAALALALALGGCAFSSENNPLSSGELSIEKEKEITADVASQIREHLPLVHDPILLAYINELGQEIVAVTEPQPFVYRFALIDDDSLNAFTIGGGYVYLNTGVMEQAGNLSELVGVIAHEVAHVRRRHIARRNEGQTLAMLINMAALAAVALAGADPGLLMLGQGINVSLELKHSRAAESEADREAIGYMVRADYDPDGLTRFFERLVAAHPDPGQIPAYLYTHPAVKERIAATRVDIARADVPRDLRRDDPMLALMQTRLARILSPPPGGSGLHAAPEFDRSVTDPLIEQAEAQRLVGRNAAADEFLAEAELREPNDPRVALRRADLAEDRHDWEAARRHLQRAFELDPAAPLVQHRLGVAHLSLDNRTQAAFYLEQAAAGYRPGSLRRKRVEFDLSRLLFPVLDESGISGSAEQGDRRDFRRGERIRWWAGISNRFTSYNPELRVVWRDPQGLKAHVDRIRMNPLGNFSSEFDSSGAVLGIWTVEIEAFSTPVDSFTFRLYADGP